MGLSLMTSKGKEQMNPVLYLLTLAPSVLIAWLTERTLDSSLPL